jgi:hypothetical protein
VVDGGLFCTLQFEFVSRLSVLDGASAVSVAWLGSEEKLRGGQISLEPKVTASIRAR